MKTSKIILSCLWQSCEYDCYTLMDLNTHIADHLLLNEGNGKYQCVWESCKVQVENFVDFQRHVFYHGYYSSLIINGRFECDKRPDVPKCSVLEKNDKIPELKCNFNCEWADCYRSFVSVIEFQDHIVQHANFEIDMIKNGNEVRTKIQCSWSYCNKEVKNRSRFIEHVRTHCNKKEVACYHCGESFSTRNSLFEHLIRQQDINNHKFQCLQCFKYFPTKKLLNSHMKKHLNPFKCDLCYISCSSRSSLATHIRYRHLKDKPFKCKECSHECVRRSDLTKHMHHVHSKKVHQCDEAGCTYAVRTYNLLRRHYLEIHGDSPFIYLCHFCEKPFRNGKSLSQHLKVKHELKLPPGFKRFVYRVDENGFYRLKFDEKVYEKQNVLTSSLPESYRYTTASFNKWKQ